MLYKNEDMSSIPRTHKKARLGSACILGKLRQAPGSLASEHGYWTVNDPVSKTRWMIPKKWPEFDI